MSLEVIEILITEAVKDGKIDTQEYQKIVEEANNYGISEITVKSLVDQALADREKKQISQERKKEEDKKLLEQERLKIESEKLTAEIKENYDHWLEELDTTAAIYIAIGTLLGICLGFANAYTHNKSWYSYLFMAIPGAFIGILIVGLAVLLSYITKRKMFHNWPVWTWVLYLLLSLSIIIYMIIPFK